MTIIITPYFKSATNLKKQKKAVDSFRELCDTINSKRGKTMNLTIKDELIQDGYADCGCANYWTDDSKPKKAQECKHGYTRSISIMRSMDLCICDKCKIFWTAQD